MNNDKIMLFQRRQLPIYQRFKRHAEANYERFIETLQMCI